VRLLISNFIGTIQNVPIFAHKNSVIIIHARLFHVVERLDL